MKKVTIEALFAGGNSINKKKGLGSKIMFGIGLPLILNFVISIAARG